MTERLFWEGYDVRTCPAPQAILSLPVFVAHARQMLVLWDDTLFERLWCNMELATFARTSSHSVTRLTMQPLWLTQWLLLSVVTHLAAGLFLNVLLSTQVAHIWQPVAELDGWIKQRFGPTSSTTLFLIWARQAFVVAWLP